jgi:hypothetical protein
MEDASKYSKRPKLDGNKTEVFRVYYDKNRISFELFIWLEYLVMEKYASMGYKISKAFPTKSLGPIVIYKN